MAGIVLLEAMIPVITGITEASLLYDLSEKQKKKKIKKEKGEREKKKTKYADFYALETTLRCLQGNAKLS